jgi:pyrroline-5-carboxylate reductase
MKLGLIGCGFMGEAMLSATIARGVVAPDGVTVAEINDERCSLINGKYGVRVSSDPGAVVEGAEVVVFAIKPQEFDAAAHILHGRFRRDQTIVSIMAGVPIDKISRALAHAAIARVMPNTPAAILGALGHEIHVDDEEYLDMATALSGSGPGFVYMLLEAFIDAGVHIGFRREVAERLALQTLIGSAKYAEATGKHPAQLRNEVTSPAGTTAAGLLVLETAGVRGAIIDAIEAAYRRSQELGA